MTLLPKACSRHNHIFHPVSCGSLLVLRIRPSFNTTGFAVVHSSNPQDAMPQEGKHQYQVSKIDLVVPVCRNLIIPHLVSYEKSPPLGNSEQGQHPGWIPPSPPLCRLLVPRVLDTCDKGKVNEYWEYMGIWSNPTMEEAGEETVI